MDTCQYCNKPIFQTDLTASINVNNIRQLAHLACAAEADEKAFADSEYAIDCHAVAAKVQREKQS